MKDEWKSFVLGAGLMLVVTLVAYMPAMRGEFVWDDEISITDNHIVKASDGLQRSWFTTEATDYWPLTASAWWLEWRMFCDLSVGCPLGDACFYAGTRVLWVRYFCG